jgi:hypothetical protein
MDEDPAGFAGHHRSSFTAQDAMGKPEDGCPCIVQNEMEAQC